MELLLKPELSGMSDMIEAVLPAAGILMAVAQSGNTVTIHYTGTLEDGTVFDTSKQREPLSFTLGVGQVIPGFDRAVEGMSEGETKTEIIPCDQAYGPRNPQMVFRIERQRMPPEMSVEVGQQLQFETPTGEPVVAMVLEVSPETVTLDANHPLAGEDLTFEIELVRCTA